MEATAMPPPPLIQWSFAVHWEHDLFYVDMIPLSQHKGHCVTPTLQMRKQPLQRGTPRATR